jgi:hypothetical protein
MYGRLFLTAAVLIAAPNAHAQLCAGSASFASGRMQAGGQVLTNNDYSSYGVGMNFGSARGLYGGPQIANNSYDFIDESGLWVGASGGYQLRPAKEGFQICPVAGIGLGLGPDDIGGSGVDMSIRQLSAGAIIGFVAHREGNFHILPTGGLSIIHQKVTLDAPGGSADESDTFLALDLGAGFLVNSVWTIKPMLTIPLGGDGREESLSLGVSYNFGRRAAAQPAPPPTRQPARQPTRPARRSR